MVTFQIESWEGGAPENQLQHLGTKTTSLPAKLKAAPVKRGLKNIKARINTSAPSKFDPLLIPESKGGGGVAYTDNKNQFSILVQLIIRLTCWHNIWHKIMWYLLPLRSFYNFMKIILCMTSYPVVGKLPGWDYKVGWAILRNKSSCVIYILEYIGLIFWKFEIIRSKIKCLRLYRIETKGKR